MLARVFVCRNSRCSSTCAMPVSPYHSWREQPRYVRLTVTFGCDVSAMRSTCRPLAYVYWVIRSIECHLCTPAGSACAANVAAVSRTTKKNEQFRRITRHRVFEYGRIITGSRLGIPRGAPLCYIDQSRYFDVFARHSV